MANAYPASRHVPSRPLPRADFPSGTGQGGGSSLLDQVLSNTYQPGPYGNLLDAAIDRTQQQQNQAQKLSRRRLKSMLPYGTALLALAVGQLLRLGKEQVDVPPGWAVTADCGRPRDGFYAGLVGCGSIAGINHASPGFPSGFPVAGPFQTANIWQDTEEPIPGQPNGTYGFLSMRLQWVSGTDVPKFKQAGPGPFDQKPPKEQFWPSAFPMSQPIRAPAPQPRPLPWISVPIVRIDPDLIEQTDRGNDPPGTPKPRPEPDRDFEVWPEVRPQPPIPPGPPVWPTRPPPGDKEVKLRSRLLGITWKIVNPITEAVDFVDALYDALPDKWILVNGKWRINPEWRGMTDNKSKYLNARQRAELVWDNFDYIDWDQAMKNILYNEIQDRIIGAASRPVADLSREMGRPLGLEAGPAL